MRHPITKAALRLIAAVVIPVLIIATATQAGAAISTSSTPPHHFSSRSSLLSSSIKLDPMAQMRRVGLRIRLRRAQAHHQAYLKKAHAVHLRWLKRKRARQQRLAAQQASTSTSTVAAGVSAANGTMQAIAQCESGGDPTAVSADGQYRGKYQFSFATWAAVGGSGDPAAAPEAEQDRLATILYGKAGAGQWPVCGR